MCKPNKLFSIKLGQIRTSFILTLLTVKISFSLHINEIKMIKITINKDLFQDSNKGIQELEGSIWNR